MKQKPLFFIILGILHILEPISKIMYFKFSTEFSLLTILNNIFSMGDPLKFFEFWFLFPFAGIALISVKSWSYPAFYLVQFFSFYSHLTYQSYSWPYLTKTPFWSSSILLFINLGLMAYFLLPRVRKPFLDRRFRWWETNKRYFLGIPASIKCQSDPVKRVKLENISLTGCLIIGEWGVIPNEVMINFEVFGVQYLIKGLKKRVSIFQGVSSVGYQFDLDRNGLKKLKNLVKCLKLIGKEVTPLNSEKNIMVVACGAS